MTVGNRLVLVAAAAVLTLLLVEPASQVVVSVNAESAIIHQEANKMMSLAGVASDRAHRDATGAFESTRDAHDGACDDAPDIRPTEASSSANESRQDEPTQQQQQQRNHHHHHHQDQNQNWGEQPKQNQLSQQVELPALGYLLDSKLKVGRDVYNERQMKTCNRLQAGGASRLAGGSNVSSLISELMLLGVHSHVYNPTFHHQYDDPIELELSGGPKANLELCIKQLEFLERLASLESGRPRLGSRELDLHLWLDTFGRYPSSLLAGATIWPGDHGRCAGGTTKVSLGGEKSPTRYCLAALRRPEWHNGKLSSLLRIESAVCLPEACDSRPDTRKLHLVQRLIELNSADIRELGAQVVGIYCEPDRSTLWPTLASQTATLAGLVLLVCWLSVLLYCTWKAEFSKPNSKLTASLMSPIHRYHQSQYKPLTNGNTNGETQFEQQATRTGVHVRDVKSKRHELFKSLSISHNLRSLLASGESKRKSRADSLLNVRAIDGLKVICTIMIVCGHVLMSIRSELHDGLHLTDNADLLMSVSQLVPTFCVNPFFTVTGILTAYLMFKKLDSPSSLLTKPGQYLQFVISRYLRLMPAYLVVLFYCKKLAKFTASGPLWDHATSNLSRRRACEQESWWWALGLAANFKSPLEHCVPSAWYLANDFQFFLLTPLLIAILEHRPKSGPKILISCAIASIALTLAAYMRSPLADFEQIARFKAHGFSLIDIFLHHIYTQPQYRVPAYLIGLLIGHLLYRYERKLTSCKQQRGQVDITRQLGNRPEIQLDNNNNNNNKDHNNNKQTSVDEVLDGLLPAYMRLYLSKFSLFVLVMALAAPTIGRQMPFERLGSHSARLLVAVSTSLFHSAFALCSGLYVLLASTGHANGASYVNKFLQAPAWAPLARVSLSATLVNVEVINWLVQSNKTLMFYQYGHHLSLVVVSILATYLVAVLLYVLVELPIQRALDNLGAARSGSSSRSSSRTAADRQPAATGESDKEDAT